MDEFMQSAVRPDPADLTSFAGVPIKWHAGFSVLRVPDSGESPLKLPTGVTGTLARTSSSGRHGFGAGGMTKDGKPKRVARTLRRGLALL